MIKCKCNSGKNCNECNDNIENCNECKKCIECTNNPDLINKLSLEKQSALYKWILNNLRPINRINYDNLNSLQLRDKFMKYENGFYIENGTIKGAMYKLGYVHSEGVNWYFNIADKSVKLAKKDILMSKIIPSTEFSNEFHIILK